MTPTLTSAPSAPLAAREAATYARLLARFPTFRITVREFECGGAEDGRPASTGTELYWEMLPTARRGYVRGVARAATPDRLRASLREAWKCCRGWQ